MKSSTKRSANRGNDGEKSKPQYKATTGARNPNRGQPACKIWALLVLSRVCTKRSNWQSTSLRLGSPSMRSSMPSRTNQRSGTRDQSSTILHFSEQKSIVPTMTVRGTRPSTNGTSRDTWNPPELPQRIRLYPRGSLWIRIVERSVACPTATHDHPIQSD